MSKPSRRPTREARKAPPEKVKAARQRLASPQKATGRMAPTCPSVPNRLSSYQSVAEEQAAREDAVAAQLSVYRHLLPGLLKKVAKIPEPRHANKVKHQLTVVVVYGLRMGVFQMASRREANAEMSQPVFLSTLQPLFPALETLPHADPVNRVLARRDVKLLEETPMALVNRLIRHKKFHRHVIEKCYPIAVDGTEKLARDGHWWDAEWRHRQHQGEDGTWIQQYGYVLEANWVFHHGLTIPLLSACLSDGEGDPDDHKQACERKAFKRLAERLKGYCTRVPILLLLDGLYPTGPVMEPCRRYHWDYLIVLPQQCLSSVWEEVESLSPWPASNHWTHTWRGRQQHFRWINDIEYRYEHDTHSLPVHGVIGEEHWPAVDRDRGEIVDKSSRPAWISSRRLRGDCLHERCNLGARYRWGIETSMRVENHPGYHYEHAFSYDWNALKGFHYLLRLAPLLNALAQYTPRVAKQVRTPGVRAFLTFVRETCAHPWLSPPWIQQLLATPIQLRLEETLTLRPQGSLSHGGSRTCRRCPVPLIQL